MKKLALAVLLLAGCSSAPAASPEPSGPPRQLYVLDGQGIDAQGIGYFVLISCTQQPHDIATMLTFCDMDHLQAAWRQGGWNSHTYKGFDPYTTPDPSLIPLMSPTQQPT